MNNCPKGYVHYDKNRIPMQIPREQKFDPNYINYAYKNQTPNRKYLINKKFEEIRQTLSYLGKSLQNLSEMKSIKKEIGRLKNSSGDIDKKEIDERIRNLMIESEKHNVIQTPNGRCFISVNLSDGDMQKYSDAILNMTIKYKEMARALIAENSINNNNNNNNNNHNNNVDKKFIAPPNRSSTLPARRSSSQSSLPSPSPHIDKSKSINPKSAAPKIAPIIIPYHMIGTDSKTDFKRASVEKIKISDLLPKSNRDVENNSTPTSKPNSTPTSKPNSTPTSKPNSTPTSKPLVILKEAKLAKIPKTSAAPNIDVTLDEEEVRKILAEYNLSTHLAPECMEFLEMVKLMCVEEIMAELRFYEQHISRDVDRMPYGLHMPTEDIIPRSKENVESKLAESMESKLAENITPVPKSIVPELKESAMPELKESIMSSPTSTIPKLFSPYDEFQFLSLSSKSKEPMSYIFQSSSSFSSSLSFSPSSPSPSPLSSSSSSSPSSLPSLPSSSSPPSLPSSLSPPSLPSSSSPPSSSSLSSPPSESPPSLLSSFIPARRTRKSRLFRPYLRREHQKIPIDLMGHYLKNNKSWQYRISDMTKDTKDTKDIKDTKDVMGIKFIKATKANSQIISELLSIDYCP